MKGVSMIEFRCNKCGHRQDVDDKFAGQRVRCPECKEAMDLTYYAAAAPPYGAILTMARICEVVAILGLIAGCMSVILVIVLAYFPHELGENVFFGVVAAVGTLLGTLLIAVFLFAFAQVLRCIRDIARNSFSLCAL
jgi:flagellar motor component MotA